MVDGDPSYIIGVQSAAVNVICELARRNPKNYLSLAPLFFKLMTSSTNNWVLIKIIKLASGPTFLPRQWQGCGVSWKCSLWCGDADAPSRPCCLWLTGLSSLVWRSDPLGAKVGQEADRASHQPDSQVSLGQAFAPWGSPGNVLDQDANAQCECCRRAVPGTRPPSWDVAGLLSPLRF